MRPERCFPSFVLCVALLLCVLTVAVRAQDSLGNPNEASTETPTEAATENSTDTPTASPAENDATSSSSSPETETSTATTSPSTSPAPQLANSERVIVGYYPDWKLSQLAVNNLFWDKITHINYAFAIVGEDYVPKITTNTSLSTLVFYAHTNNVKVLLAIGGWTGSKYFSSLVASPDNRKTFITATKELVDTFNLDGIDIDWEYPGRRGMKCNEVDEQNDTKNFLVLLTELRKSLDANKTLTVATRAEPFDGPKGPISDMSGFAKVLDWINVMAYDLSVDDESGESWTKVTGPNAPFDFVPDMGRSLSFVQAAQTFLGTGMPASKIVMGIEFLGRSQTAAVPMQDGQFVQRAPVVPKGDVNDALWADPCPGTSQTYSGVWTWRSLRQQGLLSCTLTVAPNTPWTRHFDNITKTPWLFESDKKTYISYDDPQSVYIKADYVKNQNLKGFMIWELTSDNGKEMLDVAQAVRTDNSSPPEDDCSSSAPYDPDGSLSSAGGSDSGESQSDSRKGLGVGGAIGITFTVMTALSLLAFAFVWWKRHYGNMDANGSSLDLTGAAAGMAVSTALHRNFVIALFDYKAQQETDLSFKKGDLIEVFEKGEGPEDWWVGKVDGKVGEFPGNYVKDEF